MREVIDENANLNASTEREASNQKTFNDKLNEIDEILAVANRPDYMQELEELRAWKAATVERIRRIRGNAESYKLVCEVIALSNDLDEQSRRGPDNKEGK